MLRDLGCLDYRVISKRKITIDDPQIAAKAGDIEFYSLTIRAFKLADLEDICEDFGQVAYYQGTIPYYPRQFQLDDHHIFIAHKPMLVCGNTASMLSNTRFGEHFKVVGDRSRHFGPFPCAPAFTVSKAGDLANGGSCC